MHPMRKFFTECDRYHSVLKEVIKEGIKLAKDSRLIILVLNKNNFALEQALGNKLIKIINRTHILNGVTTRIESLRTYKDEGLNDVIVVAYFSDKEADFLDSISGASYILAVEDYEDDLGCWKRRWNTDDIESLESPKSNVKLPCVLITALDMLSKRINISNGLSNHSDEETAKTYIRTLFKFKIALDNELIKSYLIVERHWNPKDANTFISLIEKIQNGSYFKGGEKTGLKRYYDMWVEKCKEVKQ